MAKDLRVINRILLDHKFGVLRLYCAGEPDGRTVSISFSVNDKDGGRDPSKAAAKECLIAALNTRKNYLGVDDGDYDIEAAFSGVEEFLAYLKRYGFVVTRLRSIPETE